VFLSLLLPRKLDAQVYSATGWFGEALKNAAPIILITGAGGIYGSMLQNSGISEFITENFSGLSIGLFLPFLSYSMDVTMKKMMLFLMFLVIFVSAMFNVLLDLFHQLHPETDRFQMSIAEFSL